MTQILYRLIAGEAPLPEQGHRFEHDVVVDSGAMQVDAAGRYVLTLGGVDTAVQVWVPAPSGGRLRFRPGLFVAAGTSIGWRAIGAQVGGSITMEVARARNRMTLPSTMEVVYRRNSERTVLYRYDAESRQFVAASDVELARRAEIVSGSGSFSIRIGGVEALVGADGVVTASVRWRLGHTAVAGDGPAIEFWTRNQRVATVGHAQAAVNHMIQQAEILPEDGDFLFPSSGAPIMAFGVAGCRILTMEEA